MRKRVYANRPTQGRNRMRRAVAPAVAGAVMSAATAIGRAMRPRAKPRAPVRKALRAVPPMRKGIKARLNAIERKMKDEVSVITYKVDTKDTLRPTVSQALNGYRECVAISEIEAALANARFFDPATPGTLITASLASPTYSQKVRISVSSVVVIKNNYQVPCYLYYGLIKPKAATSVAPTTAWTNGLTDSGNPTNTSYLLSINDSREFRETYKGKMYRKILLPGQQVTYRHSVAPFIYDPAYFDANTQTFQPKAKCAEMFYRVHGVLGHDTTTATEQGVMPCGIDVHCRNVYRIYYNSGGASVRTIVLSQGAASSFTSAGVVSQPVVDNQSYSIV